MIRHAVGLALASWLLAAPAFAFPVSGDQTALPPGSDLAEEAPDQPRELFNSDTIGGHRSYLVELGDMAFSAPSLLGEVARRAGISCDTCHVNGANNPQLFVPRLSTRPGNFDVTNGLFNPKADNGILDPVTIPSLRGARYLAPYGHDGRQASLRDFVRNVIVNEFAGAEPSPEILDGLVAYIQSIDFIPNPRLRAGGTLTPGARDAEKRGETLFSKPFPRDANLNCASCHRPDAGFVDHIQHDVGSGGFFKTPTLMNANSNAPYFHDGRYDNYAQVVSYFDGFYALDLSTQDQRDLVAYLDAVGDGDHADELITIATRLGELQHFVTVLDRALPSHDLEVIALAVDTIGGELRDLTESFPERKDTSVPGGKEERGNARVALKEAVLLLRRIELSASAGNFEAAIGELADYRKAMIAAEPLLHAAEPWSLFDPTNRTAHYAALREMFQAAEKQPP
jgi:cytochrome c peroxidase